MRKVILAILFLLASVVGAQIPPCNPVLGMQCTPNLNMYLPPLNQPNWNTYVNANTSILDGNVQHPGTVVYVLPGETAAHAVARLPIGGGTVVFSVGTYPSGGLTITTPNITLQGSGMPGYNSATAPTALTGGTIIQGLISASQGADFLSLRDLGVDAGPAWINANNGGVATDSISISNAGQVVGAPQVQNVVIQNVSCLNYSLSSATHCILVENVNHAYVSNTMSVYGAHGAVFKGSNSNWIGHFARGHSLDGFIVKSDNYAPSSNDNISDVVIVPLAANGDTQGMIIQATNSAISYIHASNITVQAAFSAGIEIDGGSTSAANITLFNLAFDGLAPGGGVASGGCVQLLNQTSRINIENMTCNNWFQGIGASAPSGNDKTLSGSIFTNIINAGVIANGRWNITGNSFISVGGNAIIAQTGAVTATGNGFESVVGVPYSAQGGTFQSDGSIISAANVVTSAGIFAGSNIVQIVALATPTQMLASGAASGMLHVRDNTNGGSALFMIDPNIGVQIIGTSQITGLAAAQVTFSSGIWHLALSSGATPRTLEWAIVQ